MRHIHLLRFVPLLLSVAATATTIVPLSVEILAQNATAIVEATALQSESHWNDDHTRIYTYTKFQVVKSLQGQASGIITVKSIGGTAEGYTQKAAGVRGWADGEQTVLFLRPSMETNDESLVVVGLMQGDFRMLREGKTTIVSNGIPSREAVDAVDSTTGSLSPYSGNKMTIQQIEQRVRNVKKVESN